MDTSEWNKQVNVPEAEEVSKGAETSLPRFEKVLRGYDPQAVTTFVRAMLGRIRELEGQMIDLNAQLAGTVAGGAKMPGAGLTGSQDRYATFSEHVADVVRAFDQDVERIRNEAETQAARILEGAKAQAEARMRETDERRQTAASDVQRMVTEARAEADRVRLDAQAKAEEITAKAERALDDARRRATEQLSDLEGRRASMVTEIRSLRDRLLTAAGTLDAGLGDRPSDGVITVPDESVAVPQRADTGPGPFSP